MGKILDIAIEELEKINNQELLKVIKTLYIEEIMYISDKSTDIEIEDDIESFISKYKDLSDLILSNIEKAKTLMAIDSCDYKKWLGILSDDDVFYVLAERLSVIEEDGDLSSDIIESCGDKVFNMQGRLSQLRGYKVSWSGSQCVSIATR